MVSPKAMHPRLKLPDFEQTQAASSVAKYLYDRQLQWWVQSLLKLRSESNEDTGLQTLKFQDDELKAA